MTRDPHSKILTDSDIRSWREDLTTAGKKLVMTNGCFDLIHRGHAEYLAAARGLGDCLLVAVNGDTSVRSLKGSDRPVTGEADRAYLLASLEAVDYVIVFAEVRVDRLLLLLKPDIYVKGGDYTIDTLDRDECAVLKDIGAEIHFIPFKDGYSTSRLLSRL